MPTLKPLEVITARILVMRDKRILVDADLAALYGVTTKRLNEQVKRNRARFPADFMFKLTAKAVKIGVHVVRAFVQLRELMRSNKDIEQRFNQLERRVSAKLGAHDRPIVALIKSLRELTAEPVVKRRPIGFVYPKD